MVIEAIWLEERKVTFFKPVYAPFCRQTHIYETIVDIYIINVVVSKLTSQNLVQCLTQTSVYGY
jgi:hypothetical protein